MVVHVDNDEKQPLPPWAQGVATSVVSWAAIGLLSGAVFLAYIVPSRFNRLDLSQTAIRQDLLRIREEHREMHAD